MLRTFIAVLAAIVFALAALALTAGTGGASAMHYHGKQAHVAAMHFHGKQG